MMYLVTGMLTGDILGAAIGSFGTAVMATEKQLRKGEIECQIMLQT